MNLPTYLPVVLLACAAVVIPLVILGLSFLLGPKRWTPGKSNPVECGVPHAGDARGKIPVRFYRIGLLFLLFDVEIAFLYPWAISFRQAGVMGLVEILLFVLILMLGLIYAWREGALEWD